ncbi:aminodeoxychorismate synthase component I [Streptomyces sp. VNUA116]|uniref:aminodeoxychorismate synthase component I n=1 Tax=Streptomyces sp. VNUA116 TaxID=3062449 RepID=UPI002675949E|nr:aminodeoxychorismate synthase component I [Streptomyces sp. VNUA116]WKU47472.1 aminodeoxychorismate synthase component I [Streptomyces sp. VNUA116]
MRTLLVDNYDSFTYNLFHYLAEVNGREPEVVTNDDRTWRAKHLAEFDNVVISPGPGTPERAADFGICTEILRDGGLPTLGVCLGHQGIALLYGGEVGRAPEPYHGRVSPVLHEGTGLFEGLPSPFPAVRYHSLSARRLPAVLEVTARTPDGLVMGLRHRERPLWGVQFHPESIGSEHGHRILDNFRRLSERPGQPVPAAKPPAPPRETKEEPSRNLRILTAALPTSWDDEVVFDRLFRRGTHPYWLDSSSRDERTGRFSIMGDAGGPLARTVTADVHSSTVTVRSRRTTEVVTGRFLDWLDRDLRATRTEVPPLPFDFALGWVGYLGYGLKAECGGEPGHRSGEPDATMVFADRAVVLDHATGTTHLLALAEDGDECAARTWLDTTARRLAALTGLRPFPARRPGTLGALRLRHDRDAYLRLIDTCQEQIAAGESYEICLTNMAETAGTLDPWDGYRYLRRTSPAPFGALLSFGGLSVLSTSPERFLRIDREGRAESRPIKGTRPRGATPQDDARLAEDLATDEKDRAENLMIVDLVRNDLGRCARIGSVEAKDVFRVESYAKAHQLVSTVRATLREDHSAVSCVRAAFPPGSMTGAPKIRTMQIIDALEEGPRGVYSGAIGYFSLTGAADLSVVIRTAVVTPDRVRYGVGGAIIALSDPEEEYEETAVKAAPLTTLTGKDFPDRRPARDAVGI